MKSSKETVAFSGYTDKILSDSYFLFDNISKSHI